MTVSPDVIDHLVGIEPGSTLDALRRSRPATRDSVQRSFLALFQPDEAGDVGLTDRLTVAAFVAGLHKVDIVTAFYIEALAGRDKALAMAVAGEIEAAAGSGPYGSYPVGPLSTEDLPGPTFRVDAAARARFGERQAAALGHAHLLVLHPRDAGSAALQALIDAGWTSDAVVTLSQLVAFLSFQIRVVAGLQALAGVAVTGAGATIETTL
ncbi:MAG: CMD domain protein [Ancalomicrobiaceae bacterium]|nr:CMD domain protein [Ancalomicrobiaceae bacterium]